MPETAQRVDPFPSYMFFVEIDGIAQAAFVECTGLEVQVDVTEYAEGGLNSYMHKLPGRAKYSDLTLKHGTAGSDDLYVWYCDIILGTIQRRNLSIVLYSPEGGEVRRWNFTGAYPIKWTGPELRAGEGKVAIDTLVIAHQGFI